jgi:hypothetical protein
MLSAAKHLVLRPFAEFSLSAAEGLRVTHKCANLVWFDLAVRPYCAQPHYWQVYFATNKVIREAFGEAGYPTPEDRIVVVTPTPVAAG